VSWPLAVYFFVVLTLAALLLGASSVLGERHRQPATGAPYESGIVSAGSARVRFNAQFYLIAAFFVVFDLEAVFLFAWAIAGRALGWAAYAEVLVFVAVLVAALAYLWRVGALDLGPRRTAELRNRGGRTP
jgi:NADH-quinone oxidoreductase subunit A